MDSWLVELQLDRLPHTMIILPLLIRIDHPTLHLTTVVIAAVVVATMTITKRRAQSTNPQAMVGHPVGK